MHKVVSSIQKIKPPPEFIQRKSTDNKYIIRDDNISSKNNNISSNSRRLVSNQGEKKKIYILAKSKNEKNGGSNPNTNPDFYKSKKSEEIKPTTNHEKYKEIEEKYRKEKENKKVNNNIETIKSGDDKKVEEVNVTLSKGDFPVIKTYDFLYCDGGSRVNTTNNEIKETVRNDTAINNNIASDDSKIEELHKCVNRILDQF